MRAAVLGALSLLALSSLAPHAAAFHEPGSEWVAGSPYTLAGGELSLGILRWDVGLSDELTVGTLPALWAVGPWLGSPIPNAHLKVRDWYHGQVAVSASAGFLYLDGSELATRLVAENDAARLLVVQSELAGAFRSAHQYSAGLNLDLTYAAFRGRYGAQSLKGKAVEDSLRLDAWAEWRFTRVVAIRLNGRVLVYSKQPASTVRLQPKPAVTVDADVSLANVAPVGAWAVWPQLELSGKNVNFMIGAGYGHLSVPVVDVMLNQRGLLVTADFFVRFGG